MKRLENIVVGPKVGKVVCWSQEYNAYVVEFTFPEFEHMDLGNDVSLKYAIEQSKLERVGVAKLLGDELNAKEEALLLKAEQ